MRLLYLRVNCCVHDVFGHARSGRYGGGHRQTDGRGEHKSADAILAPIANYVHYQREWRGTNRMRAHFVQGHMASAARSD
jgi:hypothetical protein